MHISMLLDFYVYVAFYYKKLYFNQFYRAIKKRDLFYISTNIYYLYYESLDTYFRKICDHKNHMGHYFTLFEISFHFLR